jgi:hypothetical protein
MYEYGTLISVAAILRKGRGKRENNGGDEPYMHCIHIWQYHNEPPCATTIHK